MVAAGRVLLCWPGLPAAVFLFFFLFHAAAIPVENFPINSQLPPVARISEPFSFTFSPLTFSSSPELSMSYSLGNDTPGWLSIDSSARRLFGTPGDVFADVAPGNGDADVVGVHVELVARDATGLATANATLVVSRNPPPSVEVPLSEQIAGFGPYSAPSSLLLHPSRPFSFSFAERTFTTTTRPKGDKEKDAATTTRGARREEGPALLNYYGVSGDSAPLPSWVSFDADTLTFSGTTPPFESLVQPPQTFGFQLVASDVVGFASSASIPFSIVVGNHELTADEAVVRLNASHGKPFDYADLKETLNIDGRPLRRIEDVASVTVVGLPQWLNFDVETWGLSGTPDATAESSNVTVAVVDRYTDTLNVTIMIEMESELFVSELPDMNITAGGDLSFDLKRYLFDPQKVDISIETQPVSPWIHLDPASKKLSGTAPEPHAATYATDITVTFIATSKRSTTTDTRTMAVHIADPSSTDPTPEPTTPAKPEETKEGRSRRKLLWLLLPFLLLLCIAAIMFFIYLRRRQRRIEKGHIMEVSAPIPGTFVNHGSGSNGSSMQDMRKMLDIGPPGTSPGTATGVAGAATSAHLHESRVVSDPRAGASLQPYALSLYKDKRRSRSDTVLIEMRRSWLPRFQGIAGFGGQVTDGGSFLSDTSLSEGDAHNADETRLPGLARTTNEPYEKNRLMLDVPIVSEPLSIQPTPELAYRPTEGATGAAPVTPARRFDLSSSSSASETTSGSSSLSSQPTPIVGYARGRDNHPHYHHQNYHFYHRPRSGRLSLGVGSRLSRALKRASGQSQQQNRSSNLSSSTVRTTRTSILTTALAEERLVQAATFTATSASTVASSIASTAVVRPTIVHIPSRPGEAVHALSRRRAGGSDSTPLFFGGGNGGRARRPPSTRGVGGTSSQVSSSQGERTPSHPMSSAPASRESESDSSWDRLARDSLGIAHKDLVIPLPLAKNKNSSAYRHNMDIGLDLNPGSSKRRSSADSTGNGDGVGARSSWTIRPLQISPPPSRQPPASQPLAMTTAAAKADEGRDATTAPSTPFQIPATSRHRRQAPISQTTPSPPPLFLPPSPPAPPSNDHRGSAMATRPLPETPTPAGRGGRPPLADRLNESTPRRSGSAASSSSSTAAARRSGKGRGNRPCQDDGDDDDMWEDIRPPNSSVFGGGGEGEADSDGSFAVYI
ncbi:polarity establishment/cellular polarization [Diatrype stigma]|uniref:Polarity establishment/cellular polarization n=1 Tax=Diatrype stigma TaxID=117547 RepID=A0AAN9YSX8_9PEZI